MYQALWDIYSTLFYTVLYSIVLITSLCIHFLSEKINFYYLCPIIVGTFVHVIYSLNVPLWDICSTLF